MKIISRDVSRSDRMGFCAVGVAVQCFCALACGSTSATAPAPPVVPSGPPVITGVSPASAPAGAPALVVTVTGSNFAQGSTVQWNGTDRQTTVSSGSQLQANVSAADLQAAQTANVTAVNPGAGGGSSNPLTFTVVADKVVFSSNGALTGEDVATAHDNVWTIDPDGLNAAPLTKLLNANSSGAIRSPDGRKVAFFSDRSLSGVDALNSGVNLWVVNADGTLAIGLTRFTSAGAFTVHAFAWAPDSSKLVYACACALDGSDAAATVTNLWVVNADGSGRRTLTTLTKAGAETPMWSPDGSKVSFSSFRALDGSDAVGPAENLWVVNADGSTPTPLTRMTQVFGNVNLREAGVRWSADGRRLSFTSNRALDGGDAFAPSLVFNLWAINSDGSTPAALTRLVGVNSSDGWWSPDGSRIAFSSNRAVNGADQTSSNTNLWVMAVDGTGLLDVTASSNASAAILGWAPTGSHLRFFSNQALNGANTVTVANNVWRVNPDGTNKVPLTRLTAATVVQ